MKKTILCASLFFASIFAESTPSVNDHYVRGIEALEKCNYPEAVTNFTLAAEQSIGNPNFAENYYFLGVAHFKLNDLDFANEAFTSYLKSTNQPAYFEETLSYKFAIAEQFREGAKRYCFSSKKMPKWASGHDLALQIYDEVIHSLPCHDFAARSLFGKALIYWDDYSFRESVEALQTLIRRFPKHELAPEAYLGITRVYLEQAHREFQNPDLIVLAQINVRKFLKDFPRDERVALAEADVQAIKEEYASGLYGTGRYYERTSKPGASIIYYQNAIKQFPETKTAERCRQRLMELNVPCDLASGVQ